ncbi:hypothetical protein PO124_00875 [Bacillus licheniformis]|nr:hypothetical protein [Bacillus licheniformis]
MLDQTIDHRLFKGFQLKVKHEAALGRVDFPSSFSALLRKRSNPGRRSLKTEGTTEKLALGRLIILQNSCPFKR